MLNLNLFAHRGGNVLKLKPNNWREFWRKWRELRDAGWRLSSPDLKPRPKEA